MTVTILTGCCLSLLGGLADQSVNTCVTSPPYWGLRDYNVDGQIGLEESPEEFIEKMVAVFREVWRVLRDDGTCWVNLGDSYAGNGNGNQGKSGQRASRTFTAERLPPKRGSGIKRKDLVGMPWRVAFALQADGWYLRQDIIWSKPNPMPESVRDRCTKAHEYIFLLSKQEKYYYDMDAILEPISQNTHARCSQDVMAQAGSARSLGKTNGNMKAVMRNRPAGWATSEYYRDQTPTQKKRKSTGVGWGHGTDAVDRNRGRVKNNDSMDAALVLPGRKSGNKARKDGSARGCPADSCSNVQGSVPWEGFMRNKRSVWTVGSKSFTEAHFATYPPELIEPCILAGCPVGGTVLDPFFGAGTTGLVADRHGRHCIGVELNPEYVKIAENRLRKDAGMFADIVVAGTVLKVKQP